MAPERVRFAPSPTGALHLGSMRTALYNWLIARSTGGQLVLRIEDTDANRSDPEFTDGILDALAWAGIDWDEGPNFQSARAARHREVIDELLDQGLAYHDPTPQQDVRDWKAANPSRGWRGTPGDDGPVRLYVPHGDSVEVFDLLRGTLRFPTVSQDDVIIARADGTPTYLLANAVDDIDDGITLICRGEDHLSNCPKQAPIFSALGAPAPRYAHIPLVAGPDGSKLSKRHGATSVQELISAGYLPDALLNALALLGWGNKDDTVLTREQLLERFDVARVGKNKGIWDIDRAYWINGQHLRSLDVTEFAAALARFSGRRLDERLRTGARMVQPKSNTLSQAAEQIRYLYETPQLTSAPWEKVGGAGALPALSAARDALAGLAPWDPDSATAALQGVAERLGLKAGKVFQPARVALTGSTKSPGIGETVTALPKSDALARLDEAIALLG